MCWEYTTVRIYDTIALDAYSCRSCLHKKTIEHKEKRYTYGNSNRKSKSFVKDRDWDQFHTPDNLAKSICIEAGELLECFQWDPEKYEHRAVCEELADVMIYCMQLADKLQVNMEDIILDKMEKNEKKYPVEKGQRKCSEV